MDRVSTIKDVAKLANVSISTVSRVLNGTTPVSKESSDKVYKAVEVLDYKPNAMARSLISKKTMTIAVIIPNLSNLFFPELLRGISKAVEKEGYFLIICNTDYSSEKEEKYINQMLERRVDGFIIVSSSISNEKLTQMLKGKTSVVFVYSYADFGYNIMEDGIKATYDATKYLIHMGHKKIACIGWRFKGVNVRYMGFRKALEEFNVDFRNEYVIDCGYSKEEITNNTIKLLKMKDRPTGIVAFNDDTAIAIMMAAKDMGIKIPEDLSIIGYDNISISNILLKPLTTISVPIHKMGINAGKKIIQIIDNSISYSDTYREEYIPYELIERESVKSMDIDS
ncbi:LacI family DNA-binding transcriptional regulator [Vallitalea guaymasensis]|uniref:LacI family DNA-binding transcriptional regulator n=1 Tax=Vallitalea guaymasensis TaxID=1185412 RepID=A0A8J8SBB1_9FIRM|nr:LacI family DNA-binding transcriptional regulator [Vallitalea guaymasensis]QUH28583.1 LacI family DNA-binding transcriptional regulator [Vallitalea guaymasensis]